MVDQFPKPHGLEVQKMLILSNISKLFLGVALLSIYACSTEASGELEAVEKRNTTKENFFAKNTDKAWYVSKVAIQGKAQGTTFTIKTSEDSLLITPREVTDFFSDFDEELSTYQDSSLISRFNANQLSEVDLSKTKYFNASLSLSKQVCERTDGAFDPTVFPLVKIWGFFKDPTNPPSQAKIDSVKQYVGFLDDKNFAFDRGGILTKNNTHSSLDFNAIAQGQSVDELAHLLRERGQQDFYIEVGGEISVQGKNDRGTDWVIGIDLPTEDNDGTNAARELENYLKLSSQSVATSGSYRKFYVQNGKKYSHTIDPKTGYPVEHNLLSATVIAKSAALADAYATAFMTMGVNSTLKFVDENQDLGLSVYLLFENQSGKIERAYSEGMNDFFME